MTPYSVILKDDAALDPRLYGEVLAPLLGVTEIEARMALKRGGGIVAENLSEEQARGLADRFQADGVAAWCVPTGALPAMKAPRRATSLETLQEGLRCSLQGQPQPEILPWDRIGVVSIGLVLVPELQEEIAGVRKKDVAVVVRREQEQRDQMRDRLLSVLTRIDLSHQENAPAAGAHHYFFDQLRRREALQMKAFLDLVSEDFTQWWRVPLEESGYLDRSDDLAEGGPATCNFLAVPDIYAKTKTSTTDRTRKLAQGGNVERLAFKTMEEFNRYTKWWVWRERLRASPDLAVPESTPAAGGNGQGPKLPAEAPEPVTWEAEKSRAPSRVTMLVAAFVVVAAIAAGFRFEQRGATCITCLRLRNDHVVRFLGKPIHESLGEWKEKKSRYDEVMGREHEHLYTGFGYHRSWLFGIGAGYGRMQGGNATPELVDAAACANAILEWHTWGQASLDEVKKAHPRIFEKVKNADTAARKRWLELAAMQPDKDAAESLMKESLK